MKNTNHLIVVLLTLLFSFSSCDKDDEKDASQKFKDDFFEIQDANFVNEELPGTSSDSNLPTIESLFGNNSVLSGGSNLISLYSESDFSYILVGIEGVTGYYKIPINNLDEISGNSYLFYLLISQNLQLGNFTILVSLIDSDNLVSVYSEINVSEIEAGTGLLQVSCSWDQLNDVDLHLIEPSDEEIYYGNSYSSNGGDLDVDSNASCDIDGINNENITYSGDAIVEGGQYTVKVDFYDNCNLSSVTNYIVTAYYDGSLISTSSGSNPSTGSFVATDADYGGEGDGKTVMRFNIDSNKSAEIGKMNLLKFNYPESNKQKSKNLSPQKYPE